MRIGDRKRDNGLYVAWMRPRPRHAWGDVFRGSRSECLRVLSLLPASRETEKQCLPVGVHPEDRPQEAHEEKDSDA